MLAAATACTEMVTARSSHKARRDRFMGMSLGGLNQGSK